MLVRARAVGVNPADWKIRSGIARRFWDPPFTLGLDLCGVVEAVGGRTKHLRPGDEMYGCAFPPRAPEEAPAAMPPGLDYVRTAAPCLAWFLRERVRGKIVRTVQVSPV
ncbi:alcohol dehydrogenase catalytic domain-containing protein [Actinacidiphila oryziradicis]|uniref:alcohol dehydrogenase catalytic domain-containing protein n=1 Tax=Actinacidiphila oryziradicis TaxID=2571141 RepID=UPI002247DA1D|nr:alcohol dehydrogenase catalytic domain-containing protein [Actinacidiphila oryziradicis]